MTDSTENELSLKDIRLSFEKLPNLPGLGAYVRERRKQEGLSIKRLAAIVGCSHVAVIELEKGSGKINISTAWRILDGLGLIDNEDKKRNPSAKGLTNFASLSARDAFRHIKNR